MDHNIVFILTSFFLLSIVVNVVLVIRLVHAKKVNSGLKVIQAENREEFEFKVQKRTLTLDIALKELESANQELAKKNKTDKLTGLNNRSSYDEVIRAEFRRSKRTLLPLSLIIIDIDRFKVVNDTFGHLAGDKCLVWISQIIKNCIRRESDIAFRYGGEEFCIILPITDAKGAFSLTEILRSTIESETFQFEEEVINITASCGLYTYEQQKNFDPAKLFSLADKALYQAKKSGRNKTVAYTVDTQKVEEPKEQALKE